MNILYKYVYKDSKAFCMDEQLNRKVIFSLFFQTGFTSISIQIKKGTVFHVKNMACSILLHYAKFYYETGQARLDCKIQWQGPSREADIALK